MSKHLIEEIDPHTKVYIDTTTGIAWVENGRAGVSHSCHPNIHHTGSIRGMKNLGYWREDDVCVRSHGWIYNISSFSAEDDLDYVAAKYCKCGGKHRQKGEHS